MRALARGGARRARARRRPASADTFARRPRRLRSWRRPGRSRCRAPRSPNEPGSILLPPGAWESAFLPVARALLRGAAGALAARRRRLRDPVAGARGDQQDRVELRPQHGPELGRRGRLDAVHAGHLAALGHGRERRRDRRPVEPRGRGLLRRALSRRRRTARTDISRAIFAYNHAQWYVDDVLAAGGDVRRRLAGADVVFSLDRLAVALEEAQEQVAALERGSSPPPRRREAELGCEGGAAARRSPTTSSCSSPTGSLAEQDAFQAGQERAAATAEVERLRAELEQAEAALETARSGAESASFAPAAAGVLRMPTRADGYVFPVGGGPGAVSVGHQPPRLSGRRHRGAARRAALRARRRASCSRSSTTGAAASGLVLQTLDGLEWVYCHLSYRDPGLEPGAAGQRRAVGRPRRLDRPLDRAAPPSRPAARALPAGDAVVPGVRRDRLHLAGRARRARTCGRRPVFALVPPEEPAEDVVEFTLSRG